MNLNNYMLDAYKKAADAESPVRKPVFEKISRRPAESAPASSEGARTPSQGAPAPSRDSQARPKPFVHKPVFENVNSRIGEILDQQEADRKNLEEAKIAAKTGIWYGKSVVKPSDDDVRKAAKPLTEGALIKVPEKPREADGRESIYRRVAKFLVIIGVDEAAKIIPQLSEDQVEKIMPEIASIRSVPKEESEQILKEFQSLLDKAREEGGIDTARTILTKAYGEKRGEEILQKSVQYPNGRPFDFLSEAGADRIGVLLNGESEQGQALVLSQIEPKKAAEIIKGLDDKTKSAIVLRLVKMKNVAPQVMESVSKSLYEKMLSQNTEVSQSLDGKSVLAQILKRMDPSTESNLIAALSGEDPELGADIRRRLFTEDDLVNAEDRYLQNKLHDMDDKTIAILIKGKKADFRDKILSNLSKRRAESVLDEESLTEFLLKSESERVTSQFFADLRRAWEAGELHVRGRDDGEVWVQ